MSDFFVVCECIVFLYFSLLFFHPFVTEMLFSKIEVGFDWTTDGARRCQHWKTLFLLSFFFDGLFTLVLVLFSIVSASPSVLVCSSLSKKSKSVGFLFSSLTLCQTVKKKKLSLKKTLFPTTTCLFRLALSLAFFLIASPSFILTKCDKVRRRRRRRRRSAPGDVDALTSRHRGAS